MRLADSFLPFCDFAFHHLRSTDIDPVYPVLRNTYEHFQFDKETALWFTYLYVVYYNLNSAEQAFNRFPTPDHPVSGNMRYATGTERRGFRGNDLASININKFLAITAKSGGIVPWVEKSFESKEAGFTAKKKTGWRNARTAFETIPHNGPWSSFKWADLMKNVHGYPLVAPDIGVGGNGKNAGPVPGMVLLTGRPWQECAVNIELQEELYENCLDAGVPFEGLDQLETALCDFNSMCKGAYYVGHDIDHMMHQLDKDSIFWAARAEAIPEDFLGEIKGWHGVRKHLKNIYITKGVIEWWT